MTRQVWQWVDLVRYMRDAGHPIHFVGEYEIKQGSRRVHILDLGTHHPPVMSQVPDPHRWLVRLVTSWRGGPKITEAATRQATTRASCQNQAAAEAALRLMRGA